MGNTVHYHNHTNRRSYGLFNFLLDAVLVCITGGLWFIWIIVRELRR